MLEIIDQIRPRKDERMTLRERVFLGFCGICAVGLLLLALGGCASTQSDEEVWHRICYEQPVGRAENGMLVVRHFCVREETPQ